MPIPVLFGVRNETVLAVDYEIASAPHLGRDEGEPDCHVLELLEAASYGLVG
jgi:hypothetical protein